MASAVAAALNVILNYVCINRFGYLAAGYTTAISYAAMAIMHYVFFKRMQKNYEEIKKFYNIKLLSVLMIIVSASALLSVFLYTISIIRYVFILIILVFAIINRKRVVELLVSIKEK